MRAILMFRKELIHIIVRSFWTQTVEALKVKVAAASRYVLQCSSETFVRSKAQKNSLLVD